MLYNNYKLIKQERSGKKWSNFKVGITGNYKNLLSRFKPVDR